MQFALSKDGTKLAYETSGKGPVLIFVTGAICHRRFWPILGDVKVFSQEFKVINYDRRGRGDSTDQPPYSPEKEVEDIEALIKTVDGKVFLYGHSSGAVLALEAALKFPEKISRVAIYDASYVSNTTERNSYAILREKILNLLAKKEHSKALREFLVGIGMPKVFAYFLPLMPGWKKMKSLAPTLAYDMELTADLPPLARLKNIKIPVEIIFGEKSPASIHSVAQQLAQTIAQSRLQKIEKQDHMVSAKILLPHLVRSLKN